MIAASIAIFLAGMIALQAAGTAKARSAAEDDKGPVFCFAMQRAPKSPAEKTGPRHCGKRSRLQPGLAQIRFIEVARHRPDAGGYGYSDDCPEHEQRKASRA